MYLVIVFLKSKKDEETPELIVHTGFESFSDAKSDALLFNEKEVEKLLICKHYREMKVEKKSVISFEK